jgi:hypothetical protein
MNAMDRLAWAAGPVAHFTAAADAMPAVLIRRADQLQRSTEGLAEEAELGSIADAPTGYELMRWPECKVQDGKG